MSRMIWFFVFCLIGLIGGISFAVDLAETKIGAILKGVFFAPIGIFLGALIGALAMLIFSLIGRAIIPSETVVISETEICSLSDSAEYSGRFVLGTGYVKSELCIYYVSVTPDGKKMESFKWSNTYIVESDNETPKVTITGDRYKWEWVEWIFPELSAMLEGVDKATITVPENTVTTQYSIDLE